MSHEPALSDGSSRKRGVARWVRDAKNNERHVCGRRRAGVAAVSYACSRENRRVLETVR